MYRPEEWKGYHCEELCIDCETNPVDCNKHYEAGADAMLEGLKKGGTLGDFYNCFRIDVEGLVSQPPSTKSYLVFISEEE